MDIKQLIESSKECINRPFGGCLDCTYYKNKCPVEYMSNGTTKFDKVKLIVAAYNQGKNE